MQIASLRYFIELANAGSFYAAAQNVRLSQQGLNKAITSLENELGLKLVERTHRGIRLTRDGETVLGHTHTILDEYDRMIDELYATHASAENSDSICIFVSYYAGQIAAANPAYVNMLADRTSYIEEPYEKLLKHAETSDGSYLVFLDVHSHSLEKLASRRGLVFEPIFQTRYGFVWKEGSPLARETMLHRETVSKMPVAVNAFREMAQLTDRLFHETPLQDIRMEAASPRMLLEYVQSSDSGIAAFDSFGFFLSQRDGDMPTDGLHFTPLSTPSALCQVGFLYPKHVKLTTRAQHTVDMLKRFLLTHYPEYFG